MEKRRTAFIGLLALACAVCMSVPGTSQILQNSGCSRATGTGGCVGQNTPVLNTPSFASVGTSLNAFAILNGSTREGSVFETSSSVTLVGDNGNNSGITVRSDTSSNPSGWYVLGTGQSGANPGDLIPGSNNSSYNIGSATRPAEEGFFSTPSNGTVLSIQTGTTQVGGLYVSGAPNIHVLASNGYNIELSTRSNASSAPTSRWEIEGTTPNIGSSGDFVAGADNAYNVGAPTNRVKAVYSVDTVGTTAEFSGAVSVGSLKSTGSAVTLSGTGTPTCASTGTGCNNTAGDVTAGATATSVVVTFNGMFGTGVPTCNVTPHTQLVAFSYVVTATAITITQTATSGDIISYECFAH